MKVTLEIERRNRDKLDANIKVTDAEIKELFELFEKVVEKETRIEIPPVRKRGRPRKIAA